MPSSTTCPEVGVQQSRSPRRHPRRGRGHGISGLKVAFNNVFGYYLEVRNAHKDKVPEGWIRKQTLTRSRALHHRGIEGIGIPNPSQPKTRHKPWKPPPFPALSPPVYRELPSLMGNAWAMGLLDMLSSHAESAVELGYTRPACTTGEHLHLGGPAPRHRTATAPGRNLRRQRHPTRSRHPANPDGHRPNMSGKSALLDKPH